jgi:uncharacterized protein YndB with AHSA1/START domain
MTDKTETETEKEKATTMPRNIPVGSLHYVDGRGTVRMEGVYDTDIDDLWSAVTDPTRLSRWVADVTGDLRLGGKFSASFTSGWEGTGTVTVCDAPHRLLVTLDPESEGEPEMTIEALLTAEGNETRLVIEDSGFTRDDLAAHGAGWQAHVEDLVISLSGNERGDWSARWKQLSPTYNDMSAALD